MILDWLEEWFKGVLIDGITSNLTGLFDTVNGKVGEIAADVGATPQDWNSGVFNMLRSLSETVIVPIAGAILALIMCYELIQLIAERNSMSCKSEIVSVFLTTPDDIFVCDPEAEYFPLVQRLHGQVIKLSPTSKDYVNPLDINLNYSEDENPLALKSDFVLSFCELVMGGKNGLEPIEKTVIDRAVQVIYRPYLADPSPEKMPVLSDLHAALTAQHIPEADRVAQALDLYVSGSLNVFNHRTNVDIENRLVCFDIKDLGKQLKKLGMLIVQDQIWGRVTANRSMGKATWYFADEFHLLLKEEQTAAYSAEIWKRFRKWGGIPTGATQNVKDLLSSPEIENILENSDFITLLNQASGDRKILAERLNLSPDHQKYIDNSEPGAGLLIFENVILPFTNPIPGNTELYKIMTTRLSEVVEGGA